MITATQILFLAKMAAANLSGTALSGSSLERIMKTFSGGMKGVKKKPVANMAGRSGMVQPMPINKTILPGAGRFV